MKKPVLRVETSLRYPQCQNPAGTFPALAGVIGIVITGQLPYGPSAVFLTVTAQRSGPP